MDATYRLVFLFLLCLSPACGGPSPQLDPPRTIQWEMAVDGAYLAGCRQGEVVVAARSHHIERWRFSAKSAPQRMAVHAVDSIGTGPIGLLRCGTDQVVVEHTDGRRWASTAQGLVACHRPTAPTAAPVKGAQKAAIECKTVSDSERAPPTGENGIRWRSSLPDGRELVLGEWGRGLRRGGTYLDWRPVAGRLEDAAFDGQSIWAVGASGLWKWTPRRPSALPIALPPPVGARPLVGIFRDGPLFWVRDADGNGWPLSIRGGQAKVVGGGTLPDPTVELRAVIGDRRIWATRGESGIRFIDSSERTVSVETGPVSGLFPLDSRNCLIAAGDRLGLWQVRDGAPVEIAHWRLGGTTHRVFVDGDQIYAVGRPYGFVVGRLVPFK